jgi:ABC-type dipeptide/oligopeptide/nickel transport system ATPase subunit
MSAIAATKQEAKNYTRKLIDLEDETKYTLSYLAIEHDMTLKKYIETVLYQIAVNKDDSWLFEQSKDAVGDIASKNDQKKFLHYLASLR